jgi:hypothetical protein
MAGLCERRLNEFKVAISCGQKQNTAGQESLGGSWPAGVYEPDRARRA